MRGRQSASREVDVEEGCSGSSSCSSSSSSSSIGSSVVVVIYVVAAAVTGSSDERWEGNAGSWNRCDSCSSR